MQTLKTPFRAKDVVGVQTFAPDPEGMAKSRRALKGWDTPQVKDRRRDDVVSIKELMHNRHGVCG